jgi:hypothetical protein
VNGSSARRATGLLLGLLLLVSAAGCTGGRPEPDRPRPRPGSSAPTAAPAPRSVPWRVQVTHVAGELRAPGRRTLRIRVGRTISTYVDAAFLRGGYPRSDFGGAFGSFTSGAARLARRDQVLLTNRALGATTRSVHATRRTAYLSVLAPHRAVAGVTAAVDLVLVVDRGERPAQRVQVKGRLLLTRDERGAWRIFGYDVRRTQTPAGGRS